MYLPQGTELHNRYVIESLLGHGGFGITYAAYDKIVGGRVAIKEYLPRHLATRSEGKTRVSVFKGEAQKHYEYGLKKFKEEVQALRQFDRHPNVVSVRDYFEGNGTAYMVMEYAEGVTLKEYLENKGGRLSFEEARDIMMPVMDALREVHQVGLLHRDISPDNIYITVAAQVKVIDFGAARYYAGEQSKSLSVVLKSGYAPEEQYRSSGKQGAWTDVYATAATLYKLLTGQTPPDALDRMAADTLEPPHRLGVSISPPAERALLHALEVHAGQRFQAMGEFQQALLGEAFKAKQSLPASAPVPQPPAEPALMPASASDAASSPDAPPPQPPSPPHSRLPGRATNPAAVAAGVVAGIIGLILVVVLLMKGLPAVQAYLADRQANYDREEQRKAEAQLLAEAQRQKEEREKREVEKRREREEKERQEAERKEKEQKKRAEKERQLQDQALMPNEAFTLISQGYDCIRGGKYKNAKKQFALAVQRDVNNPFALNNLAVLKEREGNLKGALADLKNASSQAHKYLDKVTQTCLADGESLAARPLREKSDRSAIALIIQENINKLEAKTVRLEEDRRKKEKERKEKKRLAEEELKRQQAAEQERQRLLEQKRQEEEQRRAQQRKRQQEQQKLPSPVVKLDRVIIESLYLDPPNFQDSVSICCKYTVLSGTGQQMPVEIKIGIYEMNNLVQAPFFKRETQKSGSYIYIHNVTFTKNMNPGNFTILAEVKTANARDAKSIPFILRRYFY